MYRRPFPAFLLSVLLLNWVLPEARSEEIPKEFYDVLIRDALVYDGDSVQGRPADVGIRGELIAKVGKLENADAPVVIKAKGLVLAPGFIDTHTHSDFNPLVYPELTNKIEQGVTTEVVGNCGMSAAPILGSHHRRIQTIWAREGVVIPQLPTWRTFQEYRLELESLGMTTHFVGLVGHGNLRSAVMGMDPRPASQSEIEEMKKLLADAMKEGAYGVSFGLVYLPGIYAQKEELVEICREAAKHVGVCAFHMRSEGAKLIEAVQEVIEIAKEAQATVQISHLKAGGRDNWSKIGEAFKLIEDARLHGLKILADAYPYDSGYAELGVMLPDSLYKREDRNAYFRDLFRRTELMAELRRYDEEKKFHWDRVMIASARDKRYWKYEGATFKQIVRQWNLDPVRFLFEILADNDFEVSAFYFTQDPAVVDQVLQKPFVAVGSDSVADGSRRPHPRSFGTFPKMFRIYARERKMIEIGNIIRKMTSLPADHFGLEGRGRIKEGYFADLVLFDAGDIEDRATYQEPTKAGRGVRWVLLNGYPVLQNGKVRRVEAPVSSAESGGVVIVTSTLPPPANETAELEPPPLTVVKKGRFLLRRW